MLDLAERWSRHAVYWEAAPLLTHTLRYVPSFLERERD
jgi:hypothetical protein